jgi:hypothetical protein
MLNNNSSLASPGDSGHRASVTWRTRQRLCGRRTLRSYSGASHHPTMSHARLLIAAACCTLAFGLGTDSSSAAGTTTWSGAAFTTDSSAYTAHPTNRHNEAIIYSFRVIARFENRTDKALYLERCSPKSAQPKYAVVAVRRLIGRAGYPAYSPIWACGGHDSPIEVSAGAVRVDTLQLRGPNSFDATNRSDDAVEGRFRLRYFVGFCRAAIGCDRPINGQLSNPFRVRIARD